MALIECKVCGKSMSDKAQACPHCGTSMDAVPKCCEECGALLSDETVCPNCGCPVPTTEIIVGEAADKSKKKKTLIAGIVILLVLIGFFMIPDGSDTSGGTGDKTVATEEAKDESKADASNKVSAAAIYEAIAEVANDPFTIPEASYGFMNAHPEYFPGNSDNRGAISDYVEEGITYDHVTKSPSKYEDTLINGWGDVIDIEETEIEGQTVTAMQVVDYDGNNYLLYHLGSLDNVFEDSYVWFYGLPFDIISFENMGGGYTEAIVCGTCYIGGDAEVTE